MDIKFISYDGSYPNLCSGELTLEIDGKIYTFSGYGNHDPDHYSCFWSSGGGVYFDDDWSDYVTTGKWIINKDELPDFLKPEYKKIARIFNKNVPYGCCGGCV